MEKLQTNKLFERIRAFEWDDNKRRSNVIKHGIDFGDAIEAFYDPVAYTFLSPHPTGERRYVTVGLMRGALVAVIFTPRDETIRIISARAARRSERQMYGAETETKEQ
jgi:uncharacterized DUF497 family protein